jgi:four helix bundle protein
LKFPVYERYCLASQLRRAVLSVPTNIVEGHALWGSPSYLRHLRIALGSLAETEYLLLYARDSGYMSADLTDALLRKAGDVHRQLLALIRAVQRTAARTHM